MEPIIDVQREDVEPEGIPALLRLDRFAHVLKGGAVNHYYPLLRAEGGLADSPEVAYHSVEWAEVKRGDEWIGTMEWKTYHFRQGDEVVLLAVVPGEGIWAAAMSLIGFTKMESMLERIS